MCILRFDGYSDNEIHDTGLSFYIALLLIIAVSEKLRDNFSVVLAALVRVSKANEVNVHTIYIYTHTHTIWCTLIGGGGNKNVSVSVYARGQGVVRK